MTVQACTHLLQFIESVYLINEQNSVPFKHDLLISSHFHNLLHILHTSSGGRQLNKLCIQLLMCHFSYDASKRGLG